MLDCSSGFSCSVNYLGLLSVHSFDFNGETETARHQRERQPTASGNRA